MMKDIANFMCPFLEKQVIWSKADQFREKYWPGKPLPGAWTFSGGPNPITLKVS